MLGNVVWIVWGSGLVCFVFWCLAGTLAALTVVGLPFAVAAFRIAGFSVLPFGRRLVVVEATGGQRIAGTAIASFLWIVLAGWWLALLHLLWGVFHFLTIFGIPLGLAHFKLASICLSPLGKRNVAVGIAPAPDQAWLRLLY